MKKCSIKYLLVLALFALVPCAFAAWQPGLIQAKIKGDPASNDKMPSKWYTDLLNTIDPENLDVTAGTLMVDQNFGGEGNKVVNTFMDSGKEWNWNNYSTFAYEGQIYLEGGVTYWFWQQCDDGAAIMIGGEEVVSAGNTSGYQNGFAASHTPAATGWYDLNIMTWDWSGGKGPSAKCYGIAYSTTVTAAPTVKMLPVGTAGWNFLQDDGTGTFLRHDDGKGFNEALIVSATLPSSITQENPDSFATRTTLEVGVVAIPVPDEIYSIDEGSRYHHVGYALTAYDDEVGDYVTPVTATVSDDGTTLSFDYAEGGKYQLVWNYDLEYRVQCSAADATLGTVDPAEAWAKNGSPVTVTATPNDAEAYYFLRWKDGDGKTYQGTPATFTVTAPLKLSAVFWQVGAPVEIQVSDADLVDGKLPLLEIVAQAAEGDAIVIAAGSYEVEYNETYIPVDRKITIRGATGNPADVILKQNGDRGLRIRLSHADAVIRDLTIEGARIAGDGLIHFPSNGTGGSLLNCVLKNGAIEVDGFVQMDGPGLVQNCRFTGNKYRAGVKGVAVYMGHASAIVRNCMMTGANEGWAMTESPKGVVYIANGLLENCTIAGNKATQYSGIYATGGTIRNCIVGDNSQTAKGLELELVNTQVYTDGNATFEYCTVPTLIEGTNVNLVKEPFVDAASGDYHPRAINTIVNVGSNQDWMTGAKDIEGNDRIINTTVDIGAYEISEMPIAEESGVITIEGTDRGLPPFDVKFIATLQNCGETKDIYYKWDFGDGSVEEGLGKSEVTHEFTTVGMRQVSLVVSNASTGLSDYAIEDPVTVYSCSKTLYVAPDGASGVVSEWPYMTPATATLTLREAVKWALDGCEIIMLKGNHYIDKNETILLNGDFEIRGETGKPEDVIYTYKEKKSWGNKFFEISNQGAAIRDMTLDVAPETTMTGYTYGRIAQVSAGMITNCVLRNGHATGERVGGGAVWLSDSGIVSHCVISNCVTGIYENRDEKGHRGSAVVMTGGRLEDCLITRNSSSSDVPDWSKPKTGLGAPIAVKGGEIVNCTIVSNTAYSCAGVYVFGNSGKVVNTIIANNVSEYAGEDAIATAAVWQGDNTSYSSVFTHCFSDTLKINDNCLDFGDPLFKDAANGDYRLTPESPCVNAGTGEEVTLSVTDLAGNPRVQNRRVDIGCYETLSRGFSIIIR